jgi:hypothetical protein
MSLSPLGNRSGSERRELRLSPFSINSFMNIRDIITLIESTETLEENQPQISAPEVTGRVDINFLSQALSVKNPQIFKKAMERIFTNQTNALQRDEVIELADAFASLVALDPQESMSLMRRLGQVRPKG